MNLKIKNKNSIKNKIKIKKFILKRIKKNTNN